MRTIPENAVLVKELEANLWTGTLPSWINDVSSGGTVTAQNASRGGGRLRLDPGTASSGDTAEVETSFDFDTGPYDIVEISLRLNKSTNDTADGKLTINILDGNASDGLQYSMLNTNSDLNDKFAKLVSGTRTSFDARVVNDDERHHLRFVWDTVNDVAELYIDGLPSNEADVSDVPIGDYNIAIRTEYNGGSAWQSDVYKLALRYYNLPNQ